MKLLILTQKVDSADDNLSFFHRWIEEFAQQCEQVIVICLYEGKHALPANVRVLSLGKEQGVSRLKYLKRFYSYIWKERKNYDAVFVHMNQIYAILGGLLWRVLGKQIGLWYAHGKTSFSLRVATLFSHIVFTSTKEGFRLNSKKCEVVGQGIDTSLFVQKTQYEIGEQFKIVTAGRVTKAKNIEEMIDIVSQLREKQIPATLTVIGSGDVTYTETLGAYARAKKIEDVVFFVGSMPYTELARTLHTYDVFVNLGKTGSLDKAILDAAAARVPVVTTNTNFVYPIQDPLLELSRGYHLSSLERAQSTNTPLVWVSEENGLSVLVAKILHSISIQSVI